VSNLEPSLYFPCLNPIEQGACRLFFHGRPPLYFVTPVQPITDWFNAATYGFTERQGLWEETFGFTRTTVEIFGVDFEVYLDPRGFWEDWLLYDPIALDTTPPPCRMLDYSLSLT